MPARIRVPHRFSQPERGLVRDFPSNVSCDMIFASQGIVPYSRTKHNWTDGEIVQYGL